MITYIPAHSGMVPNSYALEYYLMQQSRYGLCLYHASSYNLVSGRLLSIIGTTHASPGGSHYV